MCTATINQVSLTHSHTLTDSHTHHTHMVPSCVCGCVACLLTVTDNVIIIIIIIAYYVIIIIIIIIIENAFVRF